MSTLRIPAARFPRALIALLCALVLLGGAAGPWLLSPQADGPEAVVQGAMVGLFLGSIVAFPWIVRKVFLGFRLEVGRDRIVVRPRFGLRRRIPLASATCVVYRRVLVQHRRSVEERWCVDVVTGTSEAAIAPLLADRRATSDDALRVGVNDWGLLGASAARSAAEWTARRTGARLLDTTGAAPVRLDPSSFDLTYRERLQRAPSLVLPSTPLPSEFDVAGAPAHSVSWRAPDSWLFWTGVAWCGLAATGWFLAIREASASGETLGARALPGLLFAAAGLLVLLASLGLRSRIAIDAESLRCEHTIYGLRWGGGPLPLARIEDVTWQEPIEAPWLPPARRVVIVTDDEWRWVHVRNEASARWLVHWLQQALLDAQGTCPTAR